MDPWAITAVERARHAEQFASLSPVNGFVTGAGAKQFFMQSGLSPMILAQIWGLADINGDGQMDLNEFSIACKLINLKLKGFDIPSVLPHSILVIPQVAAPVTPIPNVSMAMPQQPMMSMPVSGISMAPTVPVGMPMTSMPITSMHMAGQPQPMMIQPQQQMMPQVPVSMVGMPGAMPGAVQAAPVPQAPVGSDWAIPQPTLAKYTNLFQQTDKTRCGFLAGAQARTILLQSGLPQNILAQIWALSDIDNDGKLSLEEFIVSGHLCEIAGKGEPMPSTLPPHLIPPRYRKNVGSSDTVSTPGSARGDGTGSPSTFEDKRRENFNKGQAELDRRRQSLIDQQKKEEEERKKKEKEEAEAREKQKKELERQRLIEWEKTRKEELNAHRQKEQDNLLELKAKQANLNKDLEAMREKVKTLTTSISESRTGVSDVKTFIDGMRNSRDTKMKDMNDLKTKLKEQNERLLIVTQEKAQLEARNKVNAQKIADGEENPELTDFDLKKIEKEKEVVVLREKYSNLQEKETEAKDKYETIKKELEEHKEGLKNIIKSCQALYSSFDDKRREIRAEKAKRIRELTDPDHAWGNEESEVVQVQGESNGSEAIPAGGAEVKYRAIFDYTATNDDELSFVVGDVIVAQAEQTGEPGWLGGELNGKVGWFPEGYTERVDENAVVASGDQEQVAVTERNVECARALYDWTATEDSCVSFVRGESVEVLNQAEHDWWYVKKSDGARGFAPSSFFLINSTEPRGSTPADAPTISMALSTSSADLVIALHPYHSEEAGDLTFNADDVILVTARESEWWTGKIGERSGTFPYNYVEALNQTNENAPTVSDPGISTDQGAAVEPIKVQESVEEVQVTAAPAKAEALNTASIKKKKKKDDAKKLGIATVVAPYEATSKEQLTLTTGQMILIRKKTDTGWWQGEIQGKKGEKRQVGWFPATYVKVMESSGSKASAEQANYVRAAFTFNGGNDDELSFQEGDKIKVLSKDEPNWWKGELNGKVGVFPANHVEPM